VVISETSNDPLTRGQALTVTRDGRSIGELVLLRQRR
jgi:hypothetical protein